MRGDFSALKKESSHNFRGTLHQQGRVLLDRDWNAQTEIMNEWQDTAARDTFGADVAAVSIDTPESLKVTNAQITDGAVKISLKKGRVWADGLLVELDEDAVKTATYLGPPIQNSPAPDALPTVGDSDDNHDAVILETWLEELNPFQDPNLLIEPALGGVDTTERLQTAFRIRLYRKTPGDTCDSIISNLKDDFSTKGKLTVELKPTETSNGDCPLVESGGFTGFEHRLYRIEIADTNESLTGTYFKWSHLNGGLVGTGNFDTANQKVTLLGNKNAIVHSGLPEFYLEEFEYDADFGCWKVVYGAKVNLADDGTLKLLNTPGDIFKGPAPKDGEHFFRLWNGIERVDDFKTKKDLPDNLGILIQFEQEAVGKYTPSDYWSFEVRAGGIGNPLVLIGDPEKIEDDAPVSEAGYPPQGILYHRVPLAQVHWTSSTVTGEDIRDCRRQFQPLTKLKGCCTYRVGDGITSHGDFRKIQDAINALPKEGGEICILPGTYEENIALRVPHNRDIKLKGCGPQTIIKAPNGNPAIYVQYGQRITIESLAVEAHEEGIGILLEGEEMTVDGEEKEKYLQDIVLSHLFVTALKNNAIMAYTAQRLTFNNSIVHIKDVLTRKPAVYLEGDDMLVERNEIRVLSYRAGTDEEALTNDPELFIPAREAAGGLQIGGGSERVRIINNLISGGTGNGISLGRVDLMKDGKEKPNRNPFKPRDWEENPCDPADGFIDEDEENEEGYVAIAGPPLYDILIKFNRIFNMGRNGIGVASFFSLGKGMDLSDIKRLDEVAVKGVIMVSRLHIGENRIEHCMNVYSIKKIPEGMAFYMGYGGIALAIAEDLVIRDNFILNNCIDCSMPICGIYVLAAVGMDISSNKITEHLPQDFDQVNPENVLVGPRGGIWVFISLGQMDILTGYTKAHFQKSDILRNCSGSHAIKVHDNVVSVPLGRCLTVMFFGDASVLGNRFTSFGIQPVDIIKLFTGLLSKNKPIIIVLLQILGLLAGNVLLFDLGAFLLVKEFQKIFRKRAEKSEESDATDEIHKKSLKMQLQSVQEKFARLLIKGGLVQFSNNQCKLNPQGREIGIALSSILIAGLADIGFHNNQDTCDLPNDLLVTNAALAGGTIRVTGNWFKETFDHVGLSAITSGFMNVTTDNESVHCLLIKGLLILERYNLVLSALAGGVTGSILEKNGDALDKFCIKRSGLMRILQRMLRVILTKPDEKKDFATWGINISSRSRRKI